MWGSVFFAALQGFSSGMPFEVVCSLPCSANPSPFLPPSDWCFIPSPSQVDLENTVSVDSSWEPVEKALRVNGSLFLT